MLTGLVELVCLDSSRLLHKYSALNRYLLIVSSITWPILTTVITMHQEIVKRLCSAFQNFCNVFFVHTIFAFPFRRI